MSLFRLRSFFREVVLLLWRLFCCVTFLKFVLLHVAVCIPTHFFVANGVLLHYFVANGALVHKVGDYGRFALKQPVIEVQSGKITDMDFNPFQDNLLALGTSLLTSLDGSSLKEVLRCL